MRDLEPERWDCGQRCVLYRLLPSCELPDSILEVLELGQTHHLCAGSP
jgi:hypothetical protein